MLGSLVGGLITILVGTTLLPEVARQIKFNEGLGLVGWTVESKPQKQTYLQYVNERLEVEKLLK